MMKKIITLCLVVVSISALTQVKETFLGARFGHLEMDNYDARNYGGLELDVQFANNFGIQYSLLSGKNYFHMPMGPAVGLFLGLAIANPTPLNDSTNDRVGLGVLLGLLTAIIPESFSYTIPLNDQFSISPYISPFQLEFIKNEGVEDGDWHAGLGAGARVQMYFNEHKFRLSPYFEYKMYYAEHIPQGYTYGLNFSARISKGRAQ